MRQAIPSGFRACLWLGPHCGGPPVAVPFSMRPTRSGLRRFLSLIHISMALAHVPDPDLLIRTGGERRISNFLLWQAAYSELYFSDRLWPDFDEIALDEAIADYLSLIHI